MKTTTIQLYNFDELSDEAKSKALDNHNENNQFDFLEDNLSEYLNELLEEAKINGEAKLYYDLSYCQGDGVNFEGNFEYKGVNINVGDNGSIEAEADEDDEDELKNDLTEVLSEEAEAEFIEVYKEICDKIKKSGYSQIEYEQSEETFKDTCEANKYTFESDGNMRNF